MKKTKAYVIGSAFGYANWMNVDIVERMEQADLVVGVGGADVGHEYYGQPNSGCLHSSPPTDIYEFNYYQKAIKLNKKIIGICKGAQWAAALAGGAVFQDVRHPYCHDIKTDDGQEIIVNSLHHNMMDLSKLKKDKDYRLIAWAENLSPFHINGYGKDVKCEKEPEIVLFKKIRFLGLQMHPEMMLYNKHVTASMDYFQDLLEQFLVDAL